MTSEADRRPARAASPSRPAEAPAPGPTEDAGDERGSGGRDGRGDGVGVQADEAPYGEGSHAPLDDADEAPEGFEIKGNADSMLYHVPGTPFYDRTVAEVWFATAEAAEAAGFALPPSQRDGGRRASPERPALDASPPSSRTAGSVVSGWTSPTTAPTSPAGRAQPGRRTVAGVLDEALALCCGRRSR